MKVSTTSGHAVPTSVARKTLIAFFSWSGNTRDVAAQIHEKVGGDMFEIVSVDTYPSDYDECVEQARKELDRGHRPTLKSEVEGLESYEVVFVGFPNWWGTIPTPVATFLSKCDSPRKTIVPFCTHGGGRLGHSIADITKLCPHSIILDSLAIREGNAKHAHNEISDWLRRTGLIKH